MSLSHYISEADSMPAPTPARVVSAALTDYAAATDNDYAYPVEHFADYGEWLTAELQSVRFRMFCWHILEAERLDALNRLDRLERGGAWEAPKFEFETQEPQARINEARAYLSKLTAIVQPAQAWLEKGAQ